MKATVLMAMYSIRSERAFCERLNYDLLFKWFLDMRIDQPAFDPTDVHQEPPAPAGATRSRTSSSPRSSRQAKLRRYVSSDHFSVDGTLLEGVGVAQELQTQRRRRRSEPPAGRNAEVQWHGEKRSNDTHASTTDPEARLYRKSNNTAATLCFAGHLLMEHRNALIVDAELTVADGYAERATAARDARPAPHASHGGAPSLATRATTPAGSSPSVRELGFTPHVAQNTSRQRSAIDGRTTRHPGHGVSMRIRKRIEEPFGWIKTIAGGRQAPLPRPRTQPGLVQDHHRRLQPDPHHRPRHPTRLTTRAPAANPPPRRRVVSNNPPTRPTRRSRDRAPWEHPTRHSPAFPHPVKSPSPPAPSATIRPVSRHHGAGSAQTFGLVAAGRHG